MERAVIIDKRAGKLALCFEECHEENMIGAVAITRKTPEEIEAMLAAQFADKLRPVNKNVKMPMPEILDNSQASKELRAKRRKPGAK